MLLLNSVSPADVSGYTITWDRPAPMILSAGGPAPPGVTPGPLVVDATTLLTLNGRRVTLSDGFARPGHGTLIVQGTTATSLGTGSEQLLSGTGAASLVNGIAPAWMVTDNGGTGGYDFLTYGAHGYVNATYATRLRNAPNSVVGLTANTTLNGDAAAYALNTNGNAIVLRGNTLSLGNAVDPAGLILGGGSKIGQGFIAFGTSEGVIWLGPGTSTINATLTGSNGLTFAGAGKTNLGAATDLTGAVTLDSGTVNLTAIDVFAADDAGVTLADTKKKFAPPTLTISANNTLAALNAAGTGASVAIRNGAQLTIGNSANQSSHLSATITQTGVATAGFLTIAGTGLADLSGVRTLSAQDGSSIFVTAGARLRLASSSLRANTNLGIVDDGELEFAETQAGTNGGVIDTGKIAISGAGALHLIGGTLKILGGGNSYSGGTVVARGATLNITTDALPAANPDLTDAGGTLVFDQAFAGDYAGVIHDGHHKIGAPPLVGTLVKEDSLGTNAGDVRLTRPQAYTGATLIEAGTLTLAAPNALLHSSGVDLGRAAGGATARLALQSDNQIQALTDEKGNTTSVALGVSTLTLAPATKKTFAFGGSITGAGGLALAGHGTQVLSGTSTYTGPTRVTRGTLRVDGDVSASSVITIDQGGTLTGGGTVPGVTVTKGTLLPGVATSGFGRLAIAGRLTLGSGSNYDVAITSDGRPEGMATVKGPVRLGGTLRARFAGNDGPAPHTLVLTARDGISGAFADIATNLPPSFAPRVTVSGQKLLLDANAQLAATPGLTPNERAAAAALDASYNTHGKPPSAILALYKLGAAAVPSALAATSGDALAAAGTAGQETARLFGSTLLDQATLFAEGGGPDNSVVLAEPVPGPKAFMALAGAPRETSDVAATRPAWRVWSATLGGIDTRGGPSMAGATIGASGQTVTSSGGVAALERSIGPNLMLGVAGGGSGSDTAVAGAATTILTTGGHAALYDRFESGAFYKAARLAGAVYTNKDVRSVQGASLSGTFNSREIGGRIEVGRHFLFPNLLPPGARITPYVALDVARFHADGFSEQARSGAAAYALRFAGWDETSLPLSLGARWRQRIEIAGLVATPGLDVAYLHEFGRAASQTAAFASLPGASFVTRGAQPDRDAAQVKASLDLATRGGLSVFGTFATLRSANQTVYAGGGGLRYDW